MPEYFAKQCLIVIARNVFGLPNTDLISRPRQGKDFPKTLLKITNEKT